MNPEEIEEKFKKIRKERPEIAYLPGYERAKKHWLGKPLEESKGKDL